MFQPIKDAILNHSNPAGLVMHGLVVLSFAIALCVCGGAALYELTAESRARRKRDRAFRARLAARSAYYRSR